MTFAAITDEETGLDVEIAALIGTYTDPVVAYLDGEVRQEFTFVYLGKVVGGKLLQDAESMEAQWFTLLM